MADVAKPHTYYMQRALELAVRARGRTSPNPLVGAVLVKEDRIVGEGFHEAAGRPHAEIVALSQATGPVQGATLYVTLEPCSHHGRTPPCAPAVASAGIAHVVAAMVDPNPLVSGKGLAILRAAGVDVTVGVLEQEARLLNEVFVTYIGQRRPFVVMKAAMTLDGKIACASGDARWVSCGASREHAHRVRDTIRAIGVGIRTVLADDPELTTRLPEGRGRDPIRIVVDSTGAIPEDCRIIRSDSMSPVILATTSRIDPAKEALLAGRGVRVIKADGAGGRVDLSKLLGELAALEIDSLLVEGGGTLNAAFLEAGLVDKVLFYIAPKIVGGSGAPTPVGGDGIALMRDARRIRDVTVTRVGDDLLVEGYVVR
ncbi:MAG: bifunctional diaminohydroxyphosphoribosylaminopyrimidine deaminase/5-amino-6-(5-phosphoribosylamino)uracil reductase RibD [Candidatus Riflebacteria bacterium]|nr:bifunctional diaminohydroxyphosphoribosylaminopyrimidine deaminase/5-amino-6-(5-phosphoribosylamino)uracil reductase RibD [Candidatus Riflebacteria bacterium]